MTNIFKLVKKLISKILRMFTKDKRKENEITKAKINYSRRYIFNSKQLTILDRGIELGFDVDDISKVKYSAEQMLILLYAKMLNIDYHKFSSYAMPAMEMEYNLYLATIDKYLGNKYLKKLLQNGKFSIQDENIKNVIDKELLQQLDSYKEIACSKITIMDFSDKHANNTEYYNKLVKMCIDRNIDSTNLKLSSIDQMNRTYKMLESRKINSSRRNIADITKTKFMFKYNPSIKEIYARVDAMDRVNPVKIYTSELKLIDKYYQINVENSIYLYSEHSNIFKIK